MDYSDPEILRVPLEELCLHIMVISKEIRFLYSSPLFRREKNEDLNFLTLVPLDVQVFYLLFLNKWPLPHLFLSKPPVL